MTPLSEDDDVIADCRRATRYGPDHTPDDDQSLLRDQAVEAGHGAIQEEFDERGLGDARLITAVVVDEAEPFLRAQVIAEVVEWLREVDGEAVSSGSARRHADMIERQFGSKL